MHHISRASAEFEATVIQIAFLRLKSIKTTQKSQFQCNPTRKTFSIFALSGWSLLSLHVHSILVQTRPFRPFSIQNRVSECLSKETNDSGGAKVRRPAFFVAFSCLRLSRSSALSSPPCFSMCVFAKWNGRIGKVFEKEWESVRGSETQTLDVFRNIPEKWSDGKGSGSGNAMIFWSNGIFLMVPGFLQLFSAVFRVLGLL